MTAQAAGPLVAEWDRSQEAVIEAGCSERLIVDAGPGTGKTAVACARLGHLVAEEGLTPSQTWMISFTRTAIAEIRARLHSYIGDAAFAVKVATVDAHAWTIHSGYDPKASLTGTYEENIERVLDLVQGDDDVFEYLQNVEHLIVDEAQDLVGVRADLVTAIVKRLARECGITVFADEAQAIYGFSEDDPVEGAGPETGLLDRLRGDDALGFREVSLDTIHRTSARGLRSIFSDVRAAVLGGGAGLFGRIRESVSGFADGSDLKRTELGIDTLAAGSLVLFRTRPEALEASQFCQAPHSLRLSGYGANLPPWIAACFYDWTDQRMDAAEFGRRWRERIEAGCLPDYGPDEAWARLVRLGGNADGSLDLHRLRRVLSRRGAPVELAIPEFGLPGPVIGTIHASKGREADSVLLLMPAGEEFDSPEDEAEETRVLFVGSTRARSTLRVGNASKWPGSKLPSGRAYRKLPKKDQVVAMFEIGRDEDLGAYGLVGSSHQTAAEASTAQSWLMRHAGVVSSFRLVRDGDRSWNYRIMGPDGEMPVGLTSSRLRDDLWELAKRFSQKAGYAVGPQGSINYARALGSRSVVIAPDDPVAERLHAPWSQSGFIMAPRMAAFTRVGFRRKG